MIWKLKWVLWSNKILQNLSLRCFFFFWGGGGGISNIAENKALIITGINFIADFYWRLFANINKVQLFANINQYLYLVKWTRNFICQHKLVLLCVNINKVLLFANINILVSYSRTLWKNDPCYEPGLQDTHARNIHQLQFCQPIYFNGHVRLIYQLLQILNTLSSSMYIYYVLINNSYWNWIHCGLDKMATILQTAFSNAFSLI